MRKTTSKGDLDLVPIMNLVTILIPFLLLSAQFVQISTIDNALPPMTHDPKPTPVTETLDLSVQITDLGYEVRASALDEPVELGCVGGVCRSATAWDTIGLTELLEDLKRDWPDDDGMILVPGSDVPYEVVIATLDAARRTGAGAELFPSVSIAGGI